jgi:DNA polymerase-3 subunit beta
MKLESTAGALAAGLFSAELALDDRSNIEALKMVRLTVKDDRVEFVVDCLDRRVAASAPVSVIEAGEALARCVSLTGVLAKLRSDQTVRLVRNEDNVVVTAGRSRFKIPGLSLDLLPQSAAPADTAAEFSLATKDMLRLVEATSYAASEEETRYYLNGIFLHVGGNTETRTLRGVATDGHRFAQIDLSLPPSAGNMPGVIVPSKTANIVVKLLRRKNVAASVKLRVSSRLFELSLPDLRLTSKLIDATFPDYARVIPNDYGAFARVDRDELMAAIARVEATINPETKGIMSTVALAWNNGALHVCRTDPGADVDDVIDAETKGIGKTALRIALAEDTLNALTGKRVVLAVDNPGTPIHFANPDDPSTFAIVMPVRGNWEVDR